MLQDKNFTDFEQQINDDLKGKNNPNEIKDCLAEKYQLNNQFKKNYQLLGKVFSSSATYCDVKDIKNPYLFKQFTRNDIELYTSIIENLSNNLLKGILADVIWVTTNDSKYLSIVVQSYLQLLKDIKDNIFLVEKHILRLISVSKTQRNSDITQQIEKICLEKFNTSTNQRDIIDIAFILKELGIKRLHYETIFNKLISLYNNIDINELYLAEGCFEVAEKFTDNNQKRKDELFYNIGEFYYKNAENERNILKRSMFLYPKALEQYKKISNKSKYNIDNKMNEINKKLTYLRKDCYKQLNCGVIECNIQPILNLLGNQFIERIKTMDIKNILLSFATTPELTDCSLLKNEQKKSLTEIIGHTTLLDDNRIIEKDKGLSKLIDFELFLQLNAQHIITLLLNIKQNNHIDEDLIYEIFVKNNYLIQEDRKEIWKKGLFYGFCEDFLVASHLLMPQFEHLIRKQLKQYVKQPLKENQDGTEEEQSLEYFLTQEEIKEFVNEDILLILKKLFVEKSFNIRNKLAHGFLNYKELCSSPYIYFWWLCLYIILPDNFFILSKDTDEAFE